MSGLKIKASGLVLVLRKSFIHGMDLPTKAGRPLPSIHHSFVITGSGSASRGFISDYGMDGLKRVINMKDRG